MSQDGASPEVAEQTPAKPHTRRFKCNLCQRQFNRREHLQRHQSIHYNQKPFHCHLCDYACRRRDLLNRHIKLSHTKKNATPTNATVVTPPNDSDLHDFQTTLSDQTTSIRRGGVEDIDAIEDTEMQDSMVGNSQTLGPTTGISMPAFVDQESGLSNQKLPIVPVSLQSTEPPSFALNYLDSVSLPFFDAQHAFYPELSLNDAMLFPSFEDSHSSLGDGYISNERLSGPSAALPGRLSRLGSYSPEPEGDDSRTEHTEPCQHFATFLRISQEDWIWISESLTEFRSSLPQDYELPSRHAFSRYMHGFLTGFHPHFPVLHLPTMSIRQMAPELIISLAAVGAQYCLEWHQGLKLFYIAKTVALERIRIREASLDESLDFPDPADMLQTPRTSSTDYYDFTKHNSEKRLEQLKDNSTLQTVQALFFLMAMATWAGSHRQLVRQAISIQSVLAMMIRQDSLRESQSTPSTWEEWAQIESSRRTKLVIFSFFNLHRVVLNLPSPIMISDINLKLPCSEYEWKATSSRAWRAISDTSSQPPLLQDCFAMLFDSNEPAPACSSLGTHIMIHVLLQHIFSVQQATHLNTMNDELGTGISVTMRRALKKWQKGWELNSESSLNPLDKHGPIAFNSTALFHLAYIRLAADIGPARSLLDQSQTEIAERLLNQPDLTRGPTLTLAARHATAALCAPVQMGVYFVGRASSWSVMHAVCSLDYAYVLNQFLKATTGMNLNTPLESDEQAVFSVLTETLREVESSNPQGNAALLNSAPHLLGPKAVKAWAVILQGMRTWNAVDFITRTLFVYADLLEKRANGQL